MNEKDLELFSQPEETSPTAQTGLEETGLSALFDKSEKDKIKVLNDMIRDLRNYPSIGKYAERIEKLARASTNWFKGDTRIEEMVGRLLKAGNDSDLIAKELKDLLEGMVIELAKMHKQVPVQKEEAGMVNELEGPVEPLGEGPKEPQFVNDQEYAQLQKQLVPATIGLLGWLFNVVEIFNMFLTVEQKKTYASQFENLKQAAAKVKEITDKMAPSTSDMKLKGIEEDNNPEPISESTIKETLIKSKIRGFLNEELGKLMAVPAINKGPEIQEEEEESEDEDEPTEEVLEEKEETK